MNTPAQYDHELLCAEYALGLLDAEARHAFQRALSGDPALQVMLERWQRHFATLAEDIAPHEVPARVWLRIQRDLGFLPERATPAAGMLSRGWHNLTLWRWVGAGASAAALALLAVNLSIQRGTQPTTGSTYVVAALAPQGGTAHWAATIDARRGQMVVVPTGSPIVVADRSTELWLIPPHAKPIPLGVFAPNQPASMALPAAVLAQIGEHAVLAVSLEPLGGSPTGQPTGPVIATGPLHIT
ncbi:MAG TPA: anti-sigma factor [Ktedonobacterales bacterium]|nr:anti-sigma factor [Ktedonobacterales bacterium]